MNKEPLAIYEISLLTKAGVAVRDAYEVILTHHKDDVEVAGFFSDLIADWDSESEVKMVEPLTKRAATDEDYTLATEFISIGAMTGMVEELWSLFGYALLLKRKIEKRGVAPEDVQLGRYILGQCSRGGVTEAQMLMWSTDPLWKEIVSREVYDFPESWWSAVGVSLEFQELPSHSEIEKALSDAGVPERMDEIQKRWNQYATAFEALS